MSEIPIKVIDCQTSLLKENQYTLYAIIEVKS